MSQKLRQYIPVLIALIIVSVSYLYNLDRPLLWGDEADTGIEARNILKFGVPKVYDGRNILLYNNGSQVNGSLLTKKIPWIQYYIGAVSLKIFGDNTFGLRAIFALLGIISFFPINSILKNNIKYPVVSTVLILLSPQVVLFQRNARYYPVLILIYSVLLWHLSYNFKTKRMHFITAALCFILFFNTHNFAALCSCASLLIYCLFWNRKLFFSYFLSSGIGFLSWFGWYEALGPYLNQRDYMISHITTDFKQWFEMFITA